MGTENIMGQTRRKHGASFKMRMALEAIAKKEEIVSMARTHDVSANLIYKWRDQLIHMGEQVFENGKDANRAELERKIVKLEHLIGRKEVEINVLKKIFDYYESKGS